MARSCTSWHDAIAYKFDSLEPTALQHNQTVELMMLKMEILATMTDIPTDRWLMRFRLPELWLSRQDSIFDCRGFHLGFSGYPFG